MINYI